MRKADPEKVLRSLVVRLRELTMLFEEVVEQFQVPRLACTTAELSLLAAVVQWDEFISNLFVALVNRDASRFGVYLDGRVRDYVKKKFGAPTAARVKTALEQHPSMEATEQLLDESGWVPAFDAQKLQERARECFVPDVARRFQLDEGEEAVITAWRALRNYVAHRSGAARQEMNGALGTDGLPVSFRKLGAKEVRSAGAFLRAPAKAGDAPRLLYYFGAMETLAHRFCGVAQVDE